MKNFFKISPCKRVFFNPFSKEINDLAGLLEKQIRWLDKAAIRQPNSAELFGEDAEWLQEVLYELKDSNILNKDMLVTMELLLSAEALGEDCIFWKRWTEKTLNAIIKMD